MIGGRLLTTIIATVVILAGLYLTGFLPLADSRYHPSATAAYIPSATDSFDFYIEENRQRIRLALTEHFYNKSAWPFGPKYPLETVVEMRAPYQIPDSGAPCQESQSGAGKGFLMIHGLSDSPYLLKPVANSLAAAYPCSLIRGLLTPGHGTVPGDLLWVSRHDWERVAAYGVQSFAGQVDELYIVGYSNGSSLALDYVDKHRDSDFIKGLILLSPGLQASDERAFLAPYVRYVLPWVNKSADADAVKYESFTMNAAAEFYRLTQAVTDEEFSPLDIPVFMTMSSDDTTVINQTAVEFFCNKVSSSHRNLLWYRSRITNISPALDCQGLKVVDVATPEPRFITHSHVSITMPMNNLHYGIDGNYAACLAYSNDLERFTRCNENNAETVYAENNIRDENGLYQGKLVRRTTFNPLYQELVVEIQCFINENCQGIEDSIARIRGKNHDGNNRRY